MVGGQRWSLLGGWIDDLNGGKVESIYLVERRVYLKHQAASAITVESGSSLVMHYTIITHASYLRHHIYTSLFTISL